MDINLTTKNPVIGKWIVKYDDVYQMPQFVQGKIVGNSPKHKNGESVTIANIESIDMLSKVLKTYDGFEYLLVGEGKRMILLNESAFLEIALNDRPEEEEYFDYDDDDFFDD